MPTTSSDSSIFLRMGVGRRGEGGGVRGNGANDVKGKVTVFKIPR